MADRREIFEKALEGKKIPILVLDTKWHQLFNYIQPDREIKRMEGELSDLLKLQGRLNTQIKETKRLKKKLMDGIVELMDRKDNFSMKKMEESRRLIEECNEKIEDEEDELMELPPKIHRLNDRLMLYTMEFCYEVMKDNEQAIAEITAWLDQARVAVKKNIVRRQEKQLINQGMYSYMHDLLGPMIDVFDMHYDPSAQSDTGKGETEKTKLFEKMGNEDGVEQGETQ